MLSNERSGSLFWNAPTGIPQKETGEYRGDALELLQRKWEQCSCKDNLHPRGLQQPLQPWQLCPAAWGSSVASEKSRHLPGSYNITSFLTKISGLEIPLKNRRSKNQEHLGSKQLSWICSTRNPSSTIFGKTKNKNTKCLMSNKRICAENLVLLTFKRILFLLLQYVILFHSTVKGYCSRTTLIH